MSPHIELATQSDPAVDFCLWPYAPPAPAHGGWRGASILYAAMEAGGASGALFDLLTRVRSAFGPFNTVWGVKWDGEAIGLELYVYDYDRLERVRSLSRFLDAIGPQVSSPLEPDEARPYFMFSVEVDNALALGERPLDVADVYIGNPGSTVSSGLCYEMRAEGYAFKNAYFFFDAEREREEALHKASCSIHMDLDRFSPDTIVWPYVMPAEVIVVANKRYYEGFYFSRIRVDGLIAFMERAGFAPDVLQFVADNRERFAHLKFDAGYDYRMEGEHVRVLKSAVYGVI